MQHVLMVTIQGRMGFTSGYIWWMAGEEAQIWCAEHDEVGEDLLLRIDWARGTRLLDCSATVQHVLSERTCRVISGRVLYCTYALIDSEDQELLLTGLHQANPDLKAYGFQHQPAALAPCRRAAERRTGKTLGKAAPETEPRFDPRELTPDHPDFEERSETADLVPVLESDGAEQEFDTGSPRTGGKRAGASTTGSGDSASGRAVEATSRLQAMTDRLRARARRAPTPGEQRGSADMPGADLATTRTAPVPPASEVFEPSDLTPDHPEFEERSETADLVPVLESEGADREFSSGASSGDGKYVGWSTTGGGGHTPTRPGTATSRLQALAEKLRQGAPGAPPRAGRRRASRDSGGTRADGKKGFLRVSRLVTGPPHSMFLRIGDPVQLRRAVVLDHEGMDIYLRREPGIELGDTVHMVMALPDGTSLEFSGRVDRAKPRSLRVAVDVPDEYVVSAMEMMIGDGTS